MFRALALRENVDIIARSINKGNEKRGVIPNNRYGLNLAGSLAMGQVRRDDVLDGSLKAASAIAPGDATPFKVWRCRWTRNLLRRHLRHHFVDPRHGAWL